MERRQREQLALALISRSALSYGSDFSRPLLADLPRLPASLMCLAKQKKNKQATPTTSTAGGGRGLHPLTGRWRCSHADTEEEEAE